MCILHYMKPYKTLALIGRFKPLHAGAYALLAAACEQADRVIIGIGSSNKYNLRNPFTPDEVAGMIDVALQPRYTNYRLLRIPDFAHLPEYADGKCWASYVGEQFGPLDAFVSGNPFVQNLLRDTYRIIEPGALVPRERWILLRATEVRRAIAQMVPWEHLVPVPVADYLKKNGLVYRFQREFGLQTLALLASGEDFHRTEDEYAEHAHAQET